MYNPTSSVGGFPFLHTPSNICRRFNDGHSDLWEVVPHCSFAVRQADGLTLIFNSTVKRAKLRWVLIVQG